MSLSSLRATSPYAILAMLCAAYAMSFFHRVCPAVLSMDLMQDFALDGTTFSLISSTTMLGYALTQIPSGIMADIIGGRRTISLFQVLAGLAVVVFTLCDSISSALVCRFILGLVLAANIPAYKILAERVPAKDYARFTTILTCCGVLGSLLAASPLVAVSNLVGWRAALMAAGCFTVFLGLALFVLLREPETGDKRETRTIRENVRALKQGIAVVVRLRQYWLVFVWFTFAIGSMFSLVTMWWGGFLMQGNGLSKEAAGLSMSIMSLAPLPLALVVPWISENIVHSRRLFLMLAALLEAFVFGFIWLNGEPLSFLPLTVLGTMVTVGTNALGVLCFTMVRETVPLPTLATASGLMNAAGPASAAVIQLVFGMIISSSLEGGSSSYAAYSQAFGFMFAGSLVSVAATILLKDTLGRSYGDGK
ncbi:MAG: MFS transporter [Desulfovibrionaceae bacterium]|nr:MFS transporter [Desulfovibrionaceae bacterium]